MMWGAYQYHHPQFFWLLLLLVPLAGWYIWHYHRQWPELRHPAAGFLAAKGSNWLARLRPVLHLLRLLSLALLIVALARPRTSEVATQTKSGRGIDIALAIDVSASMLARDLKPNRLEATKKVASEFIKGRPSDRMSLVIFAGESYTQTPLTSDHRIMLNGLESLRHGRIEDGTAIGMGLATAVNRLKDSKAKSKVVILMTDGENNAGEIDPLTAAQLAEQFNLRTYTIGVGTKGTAPTPAAYDMRGNIIYRNLPVNIDEELLQQIANQTGGRYFRATDNDKLEEIYAEIDQLETTKLEELRFNTYQEKYAVFVLAALGLFLLENLLRYTLYRSFI